MLTLEIPSIDTQIKVPIVWSIAGSDSGGGAGVQADLKVMGAFGVHGCSAITALTAQNTLGVQAVEPVSETMLRAQLDSLAADLPPAAIKTGMLGSAETCSIAAEFLESIDAPLICDPVLKSTSGTDLLDPAAIDILIHGIFPRVTVLTPNIPETELLIGHKVESIEDAADEILAMGVESVLIKGGHAEGGECCDFWSAGGECCWLTSPRIETRHTHGTGCILSSAIASAIALGQDTMQAVQTAKNYIIQCLNSPANIGAGHGAMMTTPPTVGEIGDLTSVAGIGDPAPEPQPGSPIPATADHKHLRRLSKIFVDDPIYFITTNTNNRQCILDHPTAHEILRQEWAGALDRHGWAIGSYVVMPDHVHFFCKPTAESKKLSAFMQQWKQWTSKRLVRELNVEAPIWQSEFFDHVLRSHESYSEKWSYIERNPVAAGLVESIDDWPYMGFVHYK